jgi:hypothetical protein
MPSQALTAPVQQAPDPAPLFATPTPIASAPVDEVPPRTPSPIPPTPPKPVESTSSEAAVADSDPLSEISDYSSPPRPVAKPKRTQPTVEHKELKTVVEPKSQSTVVVPQSKPPIEPRQKSKLEAEPKSKPAAESKLKPAITTKPSPNAKPAAKPKPQADPKLKSAPKPRSKKAPQAKDITEPAQHVTTRKTRAQAAADAQAVDTTLSSDPDPAPALRPPQPEGELRSSSTLFETSSTTKRPLDQESAPPAKRQRVLPPSTPPHSPSPAPRRRPAKTGRPRIPSPPPHLVEDLRTPPGAPSVGAAIRVVPAGGSTVAPSGLKPTRPTKPVAQPVAAASASAVKRNVPVCKLEQICSPSMLTFSPQTLPEPPSDAASSEAAARSERTKAKAERAAAAFKALQQRHRAQEEVQEIAPVLEAPVVPAKPDIVPRSMANRREQAIPQTTRPASQTPPRVWTRVRNLC